MSLPAGEPWSDGDNGSSRPAVPPLRNRTRAEISNALHSIGLALDRLVDDLTLPETRAETVALPSAEPSTTELHARLCERLGQAAVDVAALEIEIAGSTATLRGRVPDALTRLLVEDIAWSLPEIADCDNQLAIA